MSNNRARALLMLVFALYGWSELQQSAFAQESTLGFEAPLRTLAPLQTAIPNFAVVSPGLMRGGTPEAAGLEALKNAGVKTIINLQGEGKGEEEEREIAGKMDLNYVHIPMNHFKQANKDQVEKFLDAVSSPENQPAYVHCARGQDRTGTMVAMYRINKQGWTASKAYTEMLGFGFHPFFVNLTSSVFNMADAMGRPEPRPDTAHIVDDLKNRFRKVLGSI